jgi:hypothetical protein
MIDPAEIILRIRAECPIFENRVAGTATFGAIIAADPGADLAVPQCFVIPNEELNITGQEQYIGDDTERRREMFAIIVAVDNTINKGVAGAGPLKLGPMQQVIECRRQIQESFNNWVPKQKFDELTFARSEHAGMNNIRLWHRFFFYTDYTAVLDNVTDEQSELVEAQIRNITEGDGTEAPAAVTDIYVTEHTPPPFEDYVENEATVSDFFLPGIGTPALPPDPTTETLDAKEEGADIHISGGEITE